MVCEEKVDFCKVYEAQTWVKGRHCKVCEDTNLGDKKTSLEDLKRGLINVNLTSIGTYQIRTTPVNGVTFSTGTTLNTFTSLGVQSVILFASGTPIASGNFNYILNSPNTNCRFTITYL